MNADSAPRLHQLEWIGMTKVKICGITRLEDALVAVDAGSDMLGFNFHPRSPRYVTPEQTAAMVAGVKERLPAGNSVRMVGVFVNLPLDEVRRIVAEASLDYAQLHGDEGVEYLAELAGVGFRVVRPQTAEEALAGATTYTPLAPKDDNAPSLLLDAYSKNAYGGTGERTDWNWAAQVAKATPRLLLAGGITADNVAEAVRAVRPWGVDVASGVEASPGIKDHDLIRAFIRAAKNP